MLENKLSDVDKRAKHIRDCHGDNPGETHTYHDGLVLGQWIGQILAYQDLLNTIDERKINNDDGLYNMQAAELGGRGFTKYLLKFNFSKYLH